MVREVVLTGADTARVPVTVVVLTLNEELNLPHALASVAGWAADTIVVDAGSTDRTAEIARLASARFVVHPFEDYSSQRNFALTLPMATDWVLFLDADEILTRDLRDEIAGVLGGSPRENGFFVRYRLVWMDQPIRFGYRPAWLLRLVRRDAARCDGRGVNEHLTVSGAAGYLSSRFIHHDRKDLSEWLRKHERYARLEAARLFAADSDERGAFFGSQSQRTRWIRTTIWRRLPPFVRPCLYFVLRYVCLGGFLDGRAGFTFHFMQALWYQTLIDIRAVGLEQ